MKLRTLTGAFWVAVCFSAWSPAQAGDYNQWVQAHNLSSASSSPADTPAGDGIPNLLKFALGLDPLAPAPQPLFEPALITRDGHQLFGVRLRLDSGAQGIRLNLYSSTDLREWTPCPVLVEKLADLGSGVLSVQVLNNQPLPGRQALFVRLGVEFTSLGQIITGPVAPLLTNSFGTEGATLTSQAPGSPLDGLVLEVPAGSYTNQQTFRITYAPIAAHNFPASIHPITPLIHVDNGGELAEKIMTLTIPISLSTNEFAMGFIYHPDSGELEGMPLLALSTNSITVATRHFSDIFISKILYSALPKTVDSGFRPGVDDWEFPNEGSFLAIGGQCSGQSQTAMWYYCEKRRKGALPLFNLYDNSLYSFRTSSFGPDNVLGIRLASRVQEDTDWNSRAVEFANKSGVSDLLTLTAFTYSIWVTDQPQMVFIGNSTPEGHAMVAYRIQNDTTSGTIFVADPNYPGVTSRQVIYDVGGNTFEPYYSGATAAALGAAFPEILYAAKTTINDWDKISQQWQEFEAGTIASADFPVFKISIKESQGGAWVETASVTTDKPSEAPLLTGADQIYLSAYYVSGPAIDGPARTAVVDTSGNRLNVGGEISLAPGTNRLGVQVFAKKAIDPDFWWSGFAWLTVISTNQGWTFTSLGGISWVTGWLDGQARNALFNHPQGVAVDSAKNIYVADTSNHVVRLLTPAGVVTTLAGQPGLAGSADGPATNALFNHPSNVAVDGSGNLYVADTRNHTIRQITRLDVGWWVTTLAGTAGSYGHADGIGSAARFWYPTGVAVDTNGNVYVGDTRNGTIRKITPEGVVTTLAGNPLYAGYKDGTGSAARFNAPCGVALDSAGNIYVADAYNCTIRKVTQAGVVTTLAGAVWPAGIGKAGYADGMGTNALFGFPQGVAVDGAGHVYVADSGNNAIRRVTSAGMVTTLGGVGSVWTWTNFQLTVEYNYGCADGSGANALFDYPEGIAVDSDSILYIADTYCGTIRKGERK